MTVWLFWDKVLQLFQKFKNHVLSVRKRKTWIHKFIYLLFLQFRNVLEVLMHKRKTLPLQLFFCFILFLKRSRTSSHFCTPGVTSMSSFFLILDLSWFPTEGMEFAYKFLSRGHMKLLRTYIRACVMDQNRISTFLSKIILRSTECQICREE